MSPYSVFDTFSESVQPQRERPVRPFNPFEEGGRRIASDYVREGAAADVARRRGEERDAITTGRALERAYAHDPVDDELKAATARLADIHKHRAGIHAQLESFITDDGPAGGGDLFARDDITRKPLKISGAYVPKLGAEVETLRAKAQQKTGLIAGALSPSKQRGDPTDEAVAAQRKLAEIEPRYRLKQEKHDRIVQPLETLDKTEREIKARIGELAAMREARYAEPRDAGYPTQQPNLNATPAVRPEPPSAAQFETRLSPADEARFREWKNQIAPTDSGEDYDFRGAFKAGVNPGEDGHWPDTFKKPNHPTFSNESIYATDRPELAGAWDGDTFVPPSDAATSSNTRVTPAGMVKLHAQLKKAEATGDLIGAENYRSRLDTGMRQLDDARQQRVMKVTNDPTFWSEFGRNAADVGLSFGAGVGSLVKLAGDLYGLTTGEMNNAVSRYGKTISDTYQPLKSDELRAAESARRQDIDAQPDELGKAWAYVKHTVSNPGLLASLVAENIPNAVGAGGTGAVARVGAEKFLLRKAATEAAKQLAARQAARIGVATAVGTGAAMQGADVGSDQYDELVASLDAMPATQAAQIPEIAALMDRGATLDEAKLSLALTQARKTGVLAGAVSVAAQNLPGATTVERAIVGGATKRAGSRLAGAAAGAVGEAASEVVEEAGGQIVKNIEAQPVDPNRPAMQGVGETAAQSALAAGVMGAGAGGLNSEPGHEQTSTPVPSESPSTPGPEAATALPEATGYRFTDAAGRNVEITATGMRDAVRQLPGDFGEVVAVEPIVPSGVVTQAEIASDVGGEKRPPQSAPASTQPGRGNDSRESPQSAGSAAMRDGDNQARADGDGGTAQFRGKEGQGESTSPVGQRAEVAALGAVDSGKASHEGRPADDKPRSGGSDDRRPVGREFQLSREVAGETPRGGSAVEQISGEKINREWSAFSPESGSLGIPRADMPQVKAEHRGALTQFLKARDITSEETEVKPSELKPTQAEFSPEKVQKAREFSGGDRAILVSQDNYVVDGHHQWMAKLTDAPDDYMRVIKLDAPIRDVLAQMKEFPSVEQAGGATPGPRPSQAGSAPNPRSGTEAGAAPAPASAEATSGKPTTLPGSATSNGSSIGVSTPNAVAPPASSLEVVQTNADRPIVQTPNGPRRVSVNVRSEPDGSARITWIKLHDDTTGVYEQFPAPKNSFGSSDAAVDAGIRLAQERFKQTALPAPKGAPTTTAPAASAVSDFTSSSAETNPEPKPGPVAQAILNNGAVPDGSTPVERIPDADETIDPDAIGGAKNPIVEKERTSEEKAPEGEKRDEVNNAKEGSTDTPFSLEQFAAWARRLAEGNMTADEVRAAWPRFKASRATLTAELGKLPKDRLVRAAGMRARSSDTKAELVRMVLDGMESEFVANGTLSFSMTGNGSRLRAIDEQISKWTDELIQKDAADRRERIAQRQKEITNPETLGEFDANVLHHGARGLTEEEKVEAGKLKGAELREWVRARGAAKLTPEQRATYERLQAEAGRATRQQEAAQRKTVEAIALPEGSDFSDVIQTKHTQKGHDLFVVQLTKRVERGVYEQLNERAKKLGGSYSSYNKGGAVPGFQFRTKETAEQFRSGEEIAGAERLASQQESRRARASARLGELAQAQIAKGQETLNQDRKTNTARRADMAAGIESRARAQIALGETMQNLATAIGANEVQFIDRINNGAQVEMMSRLLRRSRDVRIRTQVRAGEIAASYSAEEKEREKPIGEADAAYAEYPWPVVEKSALMRLAAAGREKAGAKLVADRVNKIANGFAEDWGKLDSESDLETVRELAQKLDTAVSKFSEAARMLDRFEDYDRLRKMDIRSEPELRTALREYAQYREGAAKEDPLKKLERELIGKKIPGFFPTPPTLARKVVERADIQPGMSVLEPSAGKGDLADAVRAAQPDATVDVGEVNSTLRTLLETKGYAPKFTDFLETTAADGTYDRIVMNPPFEGGQDVAHVRHAYSLLKPGGKLVAIVSEGPFFGVDRRSGEFRQWLESVGGMSEKNPEGSFAGADAFRQTGVVTRIVEITKDKAAPARELVAPQSFKETQRDLLTQLDDALAKAPSETDFTADAQREAIKQPGFRRENDTQREAEAEWVAQRARELAAQSTGTPKLTLRSGNSEFKITNTKEVIERMRKQVEKRIGPPTKPETRETAPALSPDEMRDIKSGAIDLNTGNGRGILDQATDAQLKKLGLADQFIRVGPNNVMRREAAAAIQQLKTGGNENIDVEAAAPEAPLDDGTPAAQIWRSATPDELPENIRQQVGEFESALNRSRAEGEPHAKFTPQVLSDRGARLSSGVADRFRRQVEQVFSKRIIFVEPSVDVDWGAASSPQRANTVLVNTRTDAPMIALTGHELAHNLKIQRPELHRQLSDALADLAPMPENYAGKKRAQGYDTDEQINDEWVSDVVGERWAEPEFWAEVRRATDKNPNAFRELAGAALDWLKRIVTRAKNVLSREAQAEFLPQIEKVRATIAETLREYAAAAPYSENPLQSGTDAELSGDVSSSTPEPRFEEAGPPPEPKPEEPAPVPGKPGWFFRSEPDSLRAVGLKVARQMYQRRSQADAAAIAKSVVDEIGEEQASRLALDRNDNGVPGDVKTILYGEVLARKAKRMADPNTSSTERARLQREIQQLDNVKAPGFTERGQEISALQQVYKDVHAATMAEYLDDVRRRQDAALGGDAAKKEISDAARVLTKANGETVDQALKDLRGKLDKLDLSAPVWQKYREWAANRLLEWVEDRTTLPGDKAPLVEFTNRVLDEIRSRMEGALPKVEGQERTKPTAADMLREAVENREKYADVVNTIRATFAEQYGTDSPILDEIDIALGNLGLKPYSRRLLDKAIDEAHAAMATNVAEIAKMHYTKADRLHRDMADALVTIAGVPPKEAKALAADLETRMQELTADAKKAALERLRKKHSTPRAKRILNAIERAVLLNNYGAMNRTDLADVVAKELKLPGINPADMTRLSQLADAVETAPNEAEKARAELALMNQMRITRGIGKADVATAIWYANLLSGYTTQLANVGGNVMNGTLNLATVMLTNPRHAGEALRGWIGGFGEGWQQGKAIVATGRGSREFDAKTGTASPVLELLDYQREFPNLNATIAKGLNVHAKALRYVFRVMKGVDAAFYYPAREAYARVAAAKLLEGKYQGKELYAKVRETLAISPGAFSLARAKAEREGFTGLELGLRIANIIEDMRRGTGAGREAAEGSEKFALETTFNNEPVGWAGVLYRHVAELTDKMRPGGVPVLKAFLPFVRIPTNLFNTSMNYTPLGVMRAFRGMEGTKHGQRIEFTEDERSRLLVQSIGGSLAMGGLAALALGGSTDGDEPDFTITATGPTDYRARQQLEATGWNPHSIKIGDTWVSYKDSPLLTPLALVGHVVDAVRYQKQADELTLGSKVTDAALKAPRVIFDTSMLSGLGQLFDLLQSRASAAQVGQFLARIPVTVAVPNLLNQIDRTFNPEARLPDGPMGRVGATLPFARNTGSVKTDVLGEPVERAPLDRFVSMETNDPVREVLRDKNVFISVPRRDTKIGNKPMEPQQYEAFVRVSGQAIRQRLTGVVPMLRQMDREQAEKLVDRITDQERQRAKVLVSRGVVTGRN